MLFFLTPDDFTRQWGTPRKGLKFNLLNVYLSQSTTPVIKSNMESGPGPLKRRYVPLTTRKCRNITVHFLQVVKILGGVACASLELN